MNNKIYNNSLKIGNIIYIINEENKKHANVAISKP